MSSLKPAVCADNCELISIRARAATHPSEVRPGRLMAVLAGCDRHETPRTGGSASFATGPGGRCHTCDPSVRKMPGTSHPRAPSSSSRARKRVRERAAAITGAIAPTKLAARKSVLANTHGSVDFPPSLSRDARSATNPCPSRAPRVTRGRRSFRTPHRPGRLGHGHSLPGPRTRRPGHRHALRPFPRAPALSALCGACSAAPVFRRPGRSASSRWSRR
jgi:hypothetical protein